MGFPSFSFVSRKTVAQGEQVATEANVQHAQTFEKWCNDCTDLINYCGRTLQEVEKRLSEFDALKKNLDEFIEGEVGARGVTLKKFDTLTSKLEGLEKKIDSISNSLSTPPTTVLSSAPAMPAGEVNGRDVEIRDDQVQKAINLVVDQTKATMEARLRKMLDAWLEQKSGPLVERLEAVPPPASEVSPEPPAEAEPTSVAQGAVSTESCEDETEREVEPAPNRVEPTQNVSESVSSPETPASENVETVSASGLTDLCEKVKSLTDTVSQLQTTVKDLSENSEALTRLKADLDRVHKNDGKLWNEKQDLESKLARAESKGTSLEHQLNAEKRKVEELEQAKADTETAHTTKIADLEKAKKEALENLTAEYKGKLSTATSDLQTKINTLLANLKEFAPEAVCALFGYRIGEAGIVDSGEIEGEDKARRSALYAFLEFFNGNRRREAFAKRFKVFDAALDEALKDTPEALRMCRENVQRHLNGTLVKEDEGIKVYWPQVGEAFNSEWYTSRTNVGQKIAQVHFAMVYRDGENGARVCLQKGEVSNT